MTEGQFTFTVTPADEASANALGLLPGANTFKSLRRQRQRSV